MSQAMSGGGAGQFGDTTFTKVFVGGLAWETHKEGMRAYFEQFGDILEAVVITDKNTGRSKGYGFVTFREPEAALRACIDPYPVIDGRRANCNLAYLGVNKSKIAPVPPYLQPYAHVYGGGNMRAMKSIQTAGGGVASLMSLVPADHGIQQGIPTAAYNVFPLLLGGLRLSAELLPSLWWAAGSPTAVCCLWRRRNCRRFNNGSSGQLLPLLPVRSGSWVQHCSVPPVVPVRRSCSGCHDSGTHPDDHRCRRRPPAVRWRGGVYSQFYWPSRHDNVYDSPNSAGPDGAVVPVQQAHSFSPRCGTRSEAQLGLEQPWLTLSFSRLFSTPCMHPPISSSVPTRVSSQTIYAYKS